MSDFSPRRRHRAAEERKWTSSDLLKTTIFAFGISWLRTVRCPFRGAVGGPALSPAATRSQLNWGLASLRGLGARSTAFLRRSSVKNELGTNGGQAPAGPQPRSITAYDLSQHTPETPQPVHHERKNEARLRQQRRMDSSFSA